MKILLAKNRGFCPGVQHAIDKAKSALAENWYGLQPGSDYPQSAGGEGIDAARASRSWSPSTKCRRGPPC